MIVSFEQSTSMRVFLICLAIACVGTSYVNSLEARAVYSISGISGTIDFNQNASSDPVLISVSLAGANFTADAGNAWHICTNLIALSVGHCSSSEAGRCEIFHPNAALLSAPDEAACRQGNVSLCAYGDLTNRHGPLNSSNFVLQDDSISLYGSSSVIGRALVLRLSSGTRACANIDFVGSAVRAIAPFRDFASQAILGNVWFTDFTATSSATSTLVYVDLFSSNGAMMTNQSWMVAENPVSSSNCSAWAGVFNPFSVVSSSDCSVVNQPACPVGDLVGKHGSLYFRNQTALSLFHDENLLVGGDVGGNTILNRSLTVGMSNTGSLSCATVSFLPPRVAMATFEAEGVSGSITFTQTTPFQLTSVDVDIRGLNSVAGGYHIHQFPVGPSQTDCGMVAGGHFNPLNAPATPPMGSTRDAFEIGDLSGKFGSLSGLNEINSSFTDAYLPLFGENSVVGRSIVIHYSSNRSRWVCANLTHSRPTTTVVARFNQSGVVGLIMLSQLQGDPLSETTVYVRFEEFPDVVVPSSTTAFVASMTSIFSTFLPVFTSSPTPAGTVMVSSAEELTPSFSQTPSAPVPSSSTSELPASTQRLTSFLDVPTTSSSSLLPPALSSSQDVSMPYSTAAPSSSQSSSFSISRPSFSQRLTSNSQFEPQATTSIPAYQTVLSTVEVFTGVPAASVFSTERFASSQQPSSQQPSFSTQQPSSQQPSSQQPSFSTQQPSSQQPSFSTQQPSFSTQQPSSQQPSFSTQQPSSQQPSFSSQQPSFSTQQSVGSLEPMQTSSTRRKRSTHIGQELNELSEYEILHYFDNLESDRYFVEKKRPRVAEDGPGSPVVRLRRQSTSQPVSWSVRSSCDGSAPPPRSAACRPDQPLSCSPGDLEGKHGPLTGGGARVLTDPYLPLSGPGSMEGSVLVLQFGSGEPLCASLEMVVDQPATSTPSPSPSPTTTTTPPSPPSEQEGLSTTAVIVIAVVAVLLAILVVVLIVIAVLVCVRRRGRKGKASFLDALGENGNVELSSLKYTPASSPTSRYAQQYRVIADHSPTNSTELRLEVGDVVKVVEMSEALTPDGGTEGEMWRGVSGRQEGWFLPSKVEPVPLENLNLSNEERMETMKQRNIDLAAAVIISASKTFSVSTGSGVKKPRSREPSKEGAKEKKGGKDDKVLRSKSFGNAKSNRLKTKESPGAREGRKALENTRKRASTSSLPWVTVQHISKDQIDSTPVSGRKLGQGAGKHSSYVSDDVNMILGDMPSLSPAGTQELTTASNDGLDSCASPMPPIFSKAADKTIEGEHRDDGVDNDEIRDFEQPLTYAYRAVYPCTGTSADDLSFNEGDIVYVTWAEESGWWYGSTGQLEGWFPGNCVEPLDDGMNYSESDWSPRTISRMSTLDFHNYEDDRPLSMAFSDSGQFDVDLTTALADMDSREGSQEGGLEETGAAMDGKQQELAKESVEAPNNEDIEQNKNKTERSQQDSEKVEDEKTVNVSKTSDDFTSEIMSLLAAKKTLTATTPTTESAQREQPAAEKGDSSSVSEKDSQSVKPKQQNEPPNPQEAQKPQPSPRIVKRPAVTQDNKEAADKPKDEHPKPPARRRRPPPPPASAESAGKLEGAEKAAKEQKEPLVSRTNEAQASPGPVVVQKGDGAKKAKSEQKVRRKAPRAPAIGPIRLEKVQDGEPSKQSRRRPAPLPPQQRRTQDGARNDAAPSPSRLRKNRPIPPPPSMPCPPPPVKARKNPPSESAKTGIETSQPAKPSGLLPVPASKPDNTKPSPVPTKRKKIEIIHPHSLNDSATPVQTSSAISSAVPVTTNPKPLQPLSANQPSLEPKGVSANEKQSGSQEKKINGEAALVSDPPKVVAEPSSSLAKETPVLVPPTSKPVKPSTKPKPTLKPKPKLNSAAGKGRKQQGSSSETETNSLLQPLLKVESTPSSDQPDGRVPSSTNSESSSPKPIARPRPPPRAGSSLSGGDTGTHSTDMSTQSSLKEASQPKAEDTKQDQQSLQPLPSLSTTATAATQAAKESPPMLPKQPSTSSTTSEGPNSQQPKQSPPTKPSPPKRPKAVVTSPSRAPPAPPGSTARKSFAIPQQVKTVRSVKPPAPGIGKKTKNTEKPSTTVGTTPTATPTTKPVEEPKVKPARPPPPRLQNVPNTSTFFPTPAPRKLERGASSDSTSRPTSAEVDPSATQSVRRVISPYTKQADDQLTVRLGDCVSQIKPANKDGFCYGMLDNGETGYYPSDCVEVW